MEFSMRPVSGPDRCEGTRVRVYARGCAVAASAFGVDRLENPSVEFSASHSQHAASSEEVIRST